MTQPTEISLKEYFENILALEKQNNEKALKLATAELARRLEALNGEAGRLNKMQETYYPRQVAEPRLEQIEKELRELQIFKAIAVSKASRDSVIISMVLGATSMLLAVVNTILRLLE